MIERGIVRKIFSIKEHMAFPSRVSISYNAILYVGVEMGNSGLQYINPEALVVRRVHSVSQWINLDQLNGAVHFQVNTSTGKQFISRYCYLPFKKLGSGL